jgi:molybdate transport system ATP-binding protein
LPYLTRLTTALRLPIPYLTHDLGEVARLAHSLVLIDAGQVVGFGPLAELAARADLPLALRDDAAALLHCSVAEHDPGRELTCLNVGGDTLWVPLLDAPLGSASRIRIPAREVILAGEPPEAISLHNVISGTVRRIAGDPTRRAVMVEIALTESALLARVTPDAIDRSKLSPGGPVLALIKSTSIEVLAG